MYKILTTPQPETNYIEYLATGNEFISIPFITKEGKVEIINFALEKTSSIVDFRGHSLIEPFIRVEEDIINWSSILYDYEFSWIPTFKYNDSKIEVTVRIITPKSYKGFVYGIWIKNLTNRDFHIECGVKGLWESSMSTIFHSQEIRGFKNVLLDKWTNSIILELNSTTVLAAMAISGDNEPHFYYDSEKRSYKVLNRDKLGKYEEKVFYYYYSINLERDGAGTTNVDLRRRRGNNLYEEELTWLKRHTIKVGDKLLEEKINRNIFFSYFYSIAYTIDTEEQVLLTSKSPRYYVSAAFWARDTLLWSFPAICLIDKMEARKILITSYTRYLKNAGTHSLYINGSVLYPGFELDELAAYIIALEKYIEETEDEEIINMREITQGILYILNVLNKWYSSTYGLYRTELDPSDDPVTYPYLIYDNVLIWRMLSFLEKYKYTPKTRVDELKVAIKKYGIIEGPLGKMYAWAVDGKGNYEVYDTPPGSLTLMKYYGFCDKNDEAYVNTIKYIYSSLNKYYYKNEIIEGTGCIHAPSVWVLSLCNYLLVYKDEHKLEMIKNLKLDNGFMCETIDEKGTVKTGPAFASAAGFLGYTLTKVIKEQ